MKIIRMGIVMVPGVVAILGIITFAIFLELTTAFVEWKRCDFARVITALMAYYITANIVTNTSGGN